MKTQFNAGPWTVDTARDIRYIHSAAGDILTTLTPLYDGVDNSAASAECDANATLIAEAPNLLAELSFIFDQWPEFEKDEEVNGGDLVEFMAERWPHIKAAVEKARGQS